MLKKIAQKKIFFDPVLPTMSYNNSSIHTIFSSDEESIAALLSAENYPHCGSNCGVNSPPPPHLNQPLFVWG
jgi:hypothetical protein